MERLTNYASLSDTLARLADEELAALVAKARPLHAEHPNPHSLELVWPDPRAGSLAVGASEARYYPPLISV